MAYCPLFFLLRLTEPSTSGRLASQLRLVTEAAWLGRLSGLVARMSCCLLEKVGEWSSDLQETAAPAGKQSRRS